MVSKGGDDKMKINRFYIALFLLIAGSKTAFCQTTPPTTNIPLLPAGPAWGALWQQHAAEYKALTYQAYNLAKIRLDDFIAKKGKKPKAIITDIDETVLDNSPYFVRQASKGRTYTDSTWIRWTAEVRCDTVPGAYNFLKYAQSCGVTVIYITNRFQVEQMPTIKNLQKFNLPNADSSHLLLLNGGNSSKESRRLQITKKYDVVLFLGDNLGDFSKLFDGLNTNERNEKVKVSANNFGNHFIVLPNAMYGTWEDRLYPKTAVSEKEKNDALNNLLRLNN
jgi:5'-nucleotidase (lipoprotein e(P4) family)